MARSKFFVVLAAMLTPCVFAQSSAPFPAQSGSIGMQISNLNEQAAVAEAQKKLAEVRAATPSEKPSSAKDKDGGGKDPAGMPSKTTKAASGEVVASSFAEEDLLPLIAEIEGASGRMTATLNVGQGQTLSVRPGSALKGGWRVKDITINSVTLTRLKGKGKEPETVQLSFGEAPAPAQGQQTGSARPSILPSLPR